MWVYSASGNLTFNYFMPAILDPRTDRNHSGFPRDFYLPAALQRTGLALAVALAAAASANAAILFDFANNQANSVSEPYGDSLSLTAGGITVTETGWSVANTTGTSHFAPAAVDNYNGPLWGLAVCSSNDPAGMYCLSPYHQIDNANTSGLPGGDEFVMFQFSKPVNLASIEVANYSSMDNSTAVDLTYYTASTALTTNTTLASLGVGTTANANSGSGRQVTLGMSGSNVTYLIVGASVPDAGTMVDSFKLNALSITTTPEPATFGVTAFCLAALGIASLRRERAK